MRAFAFNFAIVLSLIASVCRAEPLVVLHLDFNTIQMKKETVVDCLRTGARAGYNAVLWEVEDKVRWETCPECVHPEAFSKDEFRSILAEAKRLKLAPIPLLQTFGHAEYVLVNGKHGDWMEDPSFPACYCLSKPAVRKFLANLLAEYLDLFGPEVRHFHLGGDEAKVFGSCPVCSQCNRMELYAEHLVNLAAPLFAKGVKPGIWCDMVLGDVEAFRKSALPPSFTVWHWDYVYDGKPNGKSRAWTKHLNVLKERGHDVVFTTSSSSAGDGPFLPQYGAHMDNAAAAAALVRRDGMLGLCMSSWSVRKFPKALQFPIWDFAAKRLLDPDDSAEADERRSYARYFGPVASETMRRMTEWNGYLVMMDASGWKPYIKDATPAPKGTFDRVVAEEVGRNPNHRKELVGEARRIAVSVRNEWTACEAEGLSGEESVVLKQGVSLATRFLDGVCDAYEGKQVAVYPVEETETYYRGEQAPQAASNCATIVWSVLKSRK